MPRTADLAGAIVICPPSALDDRWSRRFPEPVTAFASGWMRVRARARQRGVELPLVISDHCDWDGLTATIAATGAADIWVTHGAEEALVHWCGTRGLAARPLHMLGYGEEDAESAPGDERMNAFAALLDRLAYEHSRNGKLRLMADYFRTTPDPDRGYALAALTGALSFRYAKPGLIRTLIAERTDPVLFAMSYDYVGDLSETVALMWPATARLRERIIAGSAEAIAPTLTEVVTTLGDARQERELPAQLARWLDGLDEIGRWALLSSSPGRCASASRRGSPRPRSRPRQPRSRRDRNRLAEPQAALWRRCLPGSRGAPRSRAAATRRRSARPCCPTLSSEADFAALDPAALCRRMEMGRHPGPGGGRPDAQGSTANRRVARLYSRTGEDISASFPDLVEALAFEGALDGELLVVRDGRVQSFNVLQQRLNRKTVQRPSCSPNFPPICAPMISWSRAIPTCATKPFARAPRPARGGRRRGSLRRASTCRRCAVRRLGGARRGASRSCAAPAPMPKRSKA